MEEEKKVSKHRRIKLNTSTSMGILRVLKIVMEDNN